jgi:hypothetical protein
MKRFFITEDEKKDILNKYSESDDKLLVYLRRHYPVIEVPEHHIDILGKYMISVDDKTIRVSQNIGRIVDKIDLEIKEIFPDLEIKKRRQTIKKFVKNFAE